MTDERPMHYLPIASKQKMDVSPAGVRVSNDISEVTCDLCLLVVKNEQASRSAE